jgi:hypothetical protein
LNRAARITTIAFAAAGIVACVVLLAVVWSGPAETPLARLAAATGAISAIIVLCVAVVIAWPGADHRPNLALALAIAVVFATWQLEGLTYRDVSRPTEVLNRCSCGAQPVLSDLPLKHIWAFPLTTE